MKSGRPVVRALQVIGGVAAMYGGVAICVENLDEIRRGFDPFISYGIVTAIVLAVRGLLRAERTTVDWVFISAGGIAAVMVFQEGSYRLDSTIAFVGLAFVGAGVFLLALATGPGRRPPFSRRAGVQAAIDLYTGFIKTVGPESAEGKQWAGRIRQLALELQNWPTKWDIEDDAGEYRFWGKPTA